MKIALNDVFAEIQDKLKMLKGVTSENDIVAACGCENAGVELF